MLRGEKPARLSESNRRGAEFAFDGATEVSVSHTQMAGKRVYPTLVECTDRDA